MICLPTWMKAVSSIFPCKTNFQLCHPMQCLLLYDHSSHCRVFGGSISCGQSCIETHQAIAYLTTNTPKRHGFHLPNPIILCKCKVCYSLVVYWKLATLRGSNQLVHILIRHCFVRKKKLSDLGGMHKNNRKKKKPRT